MASPKQKVNYTSLVKIKFHNCAIVIFSFVVFIHIAFGIGKIILTTAPDFHVFYQSAYDVVHGINPYEDKRLYTGLGYPVVTSLVYIPFLIFPFSIAQGLFVILSATAVPIIVLLSLKLASKKFSWSFLLLFSSLAFLSFPTKFTLGMGQSNLVAYLLLITSFLFFEKKFYIHSGIFTGLAMTMKPLFGFMILFFILRKAWKPILTISIVLGLFLSITLLIYGFDIYIYYLTELIPHLLKPEGREVYYNQGVSGIVSRFIEDPSLRRIVTFFLSMSLIGTTFYTLKNHWKNTILLFSLLLTVLVLIDTLAWQHHLVFLLFPYITAVMILASKKVTFISFLPLIVSYVLTSYNIKNPELFSSTWYGNFYLSHGFFGVLLLWLILVSQVEQNNSMLKKVGIAIFIIWSIFILFIYIQHLLCRAKICFPLPF